MELEQGSWMPLRWTSAVANVQIDSREVGKFVILDDYLSEEQYGVGFKLGNEALRDQVEETLIEMLEDGKFLEIATAWELQDFVCLGE